MKYNPIGTTFKEGDVTLLVMAGVPDGSTCSGCYYNMKKKNGSRVYNGSCYIHGHACTPLHRKDRKHVIFKKIQIV